MSTPLIEIAQRHDTDKTESFGYIDNYERYFSSLRELPVNLLEIGVYRGGSLLMWKDYFSNGNVIGLDINPNPLQSQPERVTFFQGSQDDRKLLERIAETHAPEGFDIIIDDAAHVGVLARQSFQALFNDHLKSGGMYVIEDWGTGYWGSWPDGALYKPVVTKDNNRYSRTGVVRARLAAKLLSWLGLQRTDLRAATTDPDFAVHNFGMVGFVKELVDQVAWGDIARSGFGDPGLTARYAQIERIAVHHGQLFVFKS